MKMFFKKTRAGWVSACLVVLLISSFDRCKKDSSTIPNVYVDFYVYLTQPANINLNAVGGWIYYTGGVKGVIVYRKGSNEFVAYERSCPYDPNAANARIEVDSSNIITIDRNCGSQFNMLDNSILHGPATRSMKTYYADYDPNAQTVHVHS